MENFESYARQTPSDKGNYLLIFQIAEEVNLKIGSMGMQTFPPGTYIYSGSALGSGGIRARLRHHLKSSPNPHWHMDYLKPNINWLAAGWMVTEKRMECVWTHKLLEMGALAPVIRFGASDCKENCPSHLLLVDKLTINLLNSLGIQDYMTFENSEQCLHR